MIALVIGTGIYIDNNIDTNDEEVVLELGGVAGRQAVLILLSISIPNLVMEVEDELPGIDIVIDINTKYEDEDENEEEVELKWMAGINIVININTNYEELAGINIAVYINTKDEEVVQELDVWY
ncbi:hypothetical protein BY996DRAFT_6455993 [Phakopsora pachyrhizi]|nr:hypothetical protein BY996DRAFT_6455993 [Phakopsora pachyrhizi]